MKNKTFILALSCLTAFSLMGCGSNSNQSSSEVSKAGTIVLNANSKNLLAGESFNLTIEYSDVPGRPSAVYSADNDVVEVTENGVVTAKKIGTSIVTVTSGGATASCRFDVSFGGQTPIIKLPGTNDGNLSVDLATTYALNPFVSFNGIGQEFTPAFSIDNEDVGVMEGNVFKPLSVGNAVIEIGGTFFGEALYPYYLNVTVKEEVIFTIYNKEDESRTFDKISLFTAETFRGKNYLNSLTLGFGLSVGGVDKSNEVQYSLVDEGGAVTIDPASMKISASKAGKAYIDLTYLEYSKRFEITVNQVVADYEGKPFTIDASIGEFPCDSIFAEFESERTIVKATSIDGKTEYEVEDGKVKGILSHNLAEQSIIVYNSKVGLVVTFKAYARIIKTAEDLKDFTINFGQGPDAVEMVKTYRNDGYYLLANDIDCTDVDFEAQTRVLGVGSTSIDGNCGFVGTFDGQGHVISNLKVAKGGLFLIIGNGAIVRNVGFKNVILDTKSDNDKFTLCTYAYNADIRNVYIESSSTFYSVNNALVAADISGGCTIVNCLFQYTGEVKVTNYYGSFTHLNGSSVNPDKFLVDCFVVSPHVMTVAAKYYADTKEIEEFSSLEFRQYPNVIHYTDREEMASSGQTFSSFDPTYWTVSDGCLTFRGI
ncbi:MAG: hypothetical protein MJ239_04165 [Bacilli bacterium]|nr:hypothetical protein [Bacilli bacterium]